MDEWINIIVKVPPCLNCCSVSNYSMIFFQMSLVRFRGRLWGFTCLEQQNVTNLTVNCVLNLDSNMLP